MVVQVTHLNLQMVFLIKINFHPIQKLTLWVNFFDKNFNEKHNSQIMCWSFVCVSEQRKMKPNKNSTCKLCWILCVCVSMENVKKKSQGKHEEIWKKEKKYFFKMNKCCKMFFFSFSLKT